MSRSTRRMRMPDAGFIRLDEPPRCDPRAHKGHAQPAHVSLWGAIRFNRVENGVTYATVNDVRRYRLGDQGDLYYPQRNATIPLTTIFSTAPSSSCAGASDIMAAALRGGPDSRPSI